MSSFPPPLSSDGRVSGSTRAPGAGRRGSSIHSSSNTATAAAAPPPAAAAPASAPTTATSTPAVQPRPPVGVRRFQFGRAPAPFTPEAVATPAAAEGGERAGEGAPTSTSPDGAQLMLRRTRNNQLPTPLSQRAFPASTAGSTAGTTTAAAAAANSADVDQSDNPNGNADVAGASGPAASAAVAAAAFGDGGGGALPDDIATANAIAAAVAMSNAIRRRRNSSGVTIVPIAPEELLRRMRLRESFMNRPRHTLTVRPQILTSYTFDKRKSFFQKKLFFARVCGCLCRSQKVESDVVVRLPNGRSQRQHQVQRTYNKILQAAIEQNRNMVKEKLQKSPFNPDANCGRNAYGNEDSEDDDDDDDYDEGRTTRSSRTTGTISNSTANPLASFRHRRGNNNNNNNNKNNNRSNNNNNNIDRSVIVLGNEERERGSEDQNSHSGEAAAVATTERQQAVQLPYTRRSTATADLSREMCAYYFSRYAHLGPTTAAARSALSPADPSTTAHGHHRHQHQRDSTTYMVDAEDAEFLHDYMEDLHTEYFNYVYKEDDHYAYHRRSFFLSHCLKRAFCFRCSLARQTELLLLEYEKRQVIKPYLCCECLFSGCDYKSQNFYYNNLYNEQYHFINRLNNYFTRYSANGKGLYSRSTAGGSSEDSDTEQGSGVDTEDGRESVNGEHIGVGRAENQSLVSNSNSHVNGELRRNNGNGSRERGRQPESAAGGGGTNAQLRRLLPLQEYDTLYHHSSSYYKRTLCCIMLLDTLSLGLCCTPFSGFFCYQGLGTALFGWRLRYMVRARYKLHRQPALLDLLFFNMCCPSWCVEQQGVQLLTGGLSEAGPSAALMR